MTDPIQAAEDAILRHREKKKAQRRAAYIPKPSFLVRPESAAFREQIRNYIRNKEKQSEGTFQIERPSDD